MTMADIKAMTDDWITPATAAKVMKMDVSRLIQYAREGQLPFAVQISGNRVKFFRTDFLRKMGFIGEPPEENSREQILKELAEIREALAAILEEARKKTG